MNAGIQVGARSRIVVDGRFFRLDGEKVWLRGVTYGPLAPGESGDGYPPEARVGEDLGRMRELGANVVRVYEVPPVWFLDLARARGVHVWVDVPWGKHLCFLDSAAGRAEARDSVRRAARGCAAHPGVLAISVVNEIPPDVVRWSGARAVAAFIAELAMVVKEVDGGCLVTFGNYPPTEYLRPQGLDFLAFNLYLHDRRPFENYLARLQMVADTKPLVVGEFGMDTLREGVGRQAEVLGWQVEAAFRSGAAGAVVYSFTDEWFRGGRLVEDWEFGLVTRDRRAKPGFWAVQRAFAAAPRFPLARCPMVSVVVACYNGGRTLGACLDSLTRLRYPSYEVILVDDGSTDGTAQIGSRYEGVRLIRHEVNEGLSVARNTGIAAARGEVVAFPAAAGGAEVEWLYDGLGPLMGGVWGGVGGPNLLPPDDSEVAAAVMVSPGGPAHVMLTDREAEHIPGCNMAFFKWALLEVGCFDPVFRTAGDDVDVCWRLQARGWRIGFSPAGYVWHYRRSTVRDYLGQQAGYGEAEALLLRKHPEYFNWAGGSMWRGRIYSPAGHGVVVQRPRIYHGPLGAGMFQTLYAPPPVAVLAFFTTLEYYGVVVGPLVVVALAFGWLPHLAVVSGVIPLAVAILAAAQARIAPGKGRFWSRPLVAGLCLLQPLVRGWARHRGQWRRDLPPISSRETLESWSRRYAGESGRLAAYWNERGMEREAFVATLGRRLKERGWPYRSDTGWGSYDLEILGSRWSRLHLVTVGEVHGEGRRLIRCRFRARWSLFAHWLFWGLASGTVLVLGVVGRFLPWVWLLGVVLPLVAWWLGREKRRLRQVVAAFVDDVATQLELVRMPSGGSSSVRRD